MPKVLERKLKSQVAKKPWSEERKSAYVYGTLRKTGWTPSHQKRKATYKRIRSRTKAGGTVAGYRAGLGGQKIRSRGAGRGLSRGKGRGPIGVPYKAK